MQKTDRQNFIIHQVNLHNKVLLNDLSEEIQVSTDTIRRDLQELSDSGKIIKVHGGAVSLSFHNGFQAEREFMPTPREGYCQEGDRTYQGWMFILTGGGTTIIELAREVT